MTPSIQRRIGLCFAATIFVSAFLLFQVQPLISKTILPWFGGTPAVWTTCMLFFQTMLFAGYLYAHVTTHYLRPRMQVACHALLLLAAMFLLPIVPAADWKPAPGDEPISRIVFMLTATVGLPFFLLSSTGPLLQGWFSRTQPGASPYRLYALSNIGSLLALISYPFVFEPALATRSQAIVWSVGFALFALCCAVCGSLVWRLRGVSDSEQSATREAARLLQSSRAAGAPTFSQRFLWFALAMAASVMLLATTNQVCLDVASVPFLWVLPLTLYLLTFILCFDSDRWYSRRLCAVSFAVSMAVVTVVLLNGSGGSLVAQVIVYFSGLFFCCMVCHGELVKLKPHPRYLTSFYLLISAGGAAGGLFVGVIAPLLFPAYLELHVGILGSVLLAAALYLRNLKASRSHADSSRSHAPAWERKPSTLRVANGNEIVDPADAAEKLGTRSVRECVPTQSVGTRSGGVGTRIALVALGVTCLAIGLALQVEETFGNAIAVSRNFYGVLRVQEEKGGKGNEGNDHRALMHGSIVHGLQFTVPFKHLLPTAYYGHDSGVGRVLSNPQQPGNQRVGVVGLGVGTVAVYGKPGDYYRFYEINPDVINFAQRHFTFLEECAAKYDIIEGDARLSLEHESPQRFDVLVLDAFSGDAIPAHLLTREATAIYRKHLKPNGILAVHISNLHFDLRPVIHALADAQDMQATAVFAHGDDNLGTKNCLWMLLSRGEISVNKETLPAIPLPPNDRRVLWTDDSSNLFEILR